MGFLDDAGVTAQDAPNDPYGFGRDFWPVQIIAADEPQVTKSGDKFGMMITWRCTDPKYAHMEKLGMDWLRLPIPKSHQGTIPWDPKSEEGQRVLFGLVNLLSALGFSKDEMGSVDENAMRGRSCLAKISVKQNEGGFWELRPYQHKPIPNAPFGNEGLNEFTPQGASNSGTSIEDALKAEMNDA